MAPSLRCPRCATIVAVVPGQAPVCPGCGFSAPPPASPAPPAPAASPAPEMAAAAPAAAPGPAFVPAPAPASPAALSPVSMPPAAVATRGKVLSPGLVVLFHIVTLGIYFFVFWWRTSREVDEATGQSRAHPVTKAGVWLIIAGAALLLVTAVAAIAILADSFIDLQDDPTYDEQQFFEDFLGAGIALIAGLVVALLLVLAGRITILVGQYRTWKATHGLEVQMGFPKPIPVGLFLAVSIIALVLGGQGNGPSNAEQAINGLLSLAALAAYLTIAALTQSHLNGIWEGRPKA